MPSARSPRSEADLEPAGQVEEHLLAMDAELVGLAGVKRDVRDLVHGLLDGDGADAPLHCSFSGPAGVGKASVALRLARLLHVIGRLRAPRVHRVTRDDLVAPFARYTAAKTGHAIREAAGGVLLVDKAYELGREDPDDHGREALDLLVQAMSDADLMVVVAGEGSRLAQFLGETPPLRALIGHELAFPAYGPEELLQIAEMMLAREGFRFDESGMAAFSGLVRDAAQQPGFENLRSMRRAIDRFRLRQARRIALHGARTAEDMATLSAADVLEDVRG